MTEQQPQDIEEDKEEDKEMLNKAINLLKRLTIGYKLSDKCGCARCDTGKFLNEIV